MANEISIVLVDDHTVVRNGLKSLIEVMGKYQVVGQYNNGLEFINAIPTLPEPDLAIIDLNMPEMNGMETMRWLRKNKPNLKVLILTLDTDDHTIIELFKLGVRGYLSKNCTAEVLKKAINDTIHGGYYHSELLQQALTVDNTNAIHAQSLMETISDREMIFIKLLCDEKEYTYDQIKDIMGVHRRTVDGYREALFERFNIKSKTGLVLYLIKHRVISL